MRAAFAVAFGAELLPFISHDVNVEGKPIEERQVRRFEPRTSVYPQNGRFDVTIADPRSNTLSILSLPYCAQA